MQTGESIEFHLTYTCGSRMTAIGTIEGVLARIDRRKALLKVQVRFVSATDKPLGHGIADIGDSCRPREMLACAVDRARRNRSLSRR